MKNTLVRQYSTNHDKLNTWVEGLEEALKVLKKTKEDIVQKVDWLNYSDYFFKETNDYIRVKNN